MAARRKLSPVETAVRSRPTPPDDLDTGEFRAALDVESWVRQTFINGDASLVNEDHAHLQEMTLGFLWTNVANRRQQMTVVGMCELGEQQATQGAWKKARAEWQIGQWFGHVPDFIVTLDAGYCAACDDIAFCALVEHELYHARYTLDEDGFPKFRQSDGKMTPAIRGHDVEEHVGVVKRYGATSDALREMAEAIKAGPSIAQIRVHQACGTCLLKAV